VTDGSSREALGRTGAAGADEIRSTARLVVDVVHASARPASGEAPRGAVHGGPGGDTTPLSPQAIRAAVHVYERGRATIGGLAAGIGVSVGWASRIVEELEARGYVVRDRDPDDRRVVWVCLSEDAITDVEGAYRWRDDAVGRALAGLSTDERAAVRRFLAALVEGLTPADG
jgi:DNA-binding MarR family transcriptional regulator